MTHDWSITDNHIRDIAQDVVAEVDRAVQKHGNYSSPHEAYGVLLEEVDEFFDEVKKQKADVSKENMRTELIQIAAVCVRAVHDLCY